MLATGRGCGVAPGTASARRAETALIYNQIQQFLLAHTRLGIPAFAIDEALHGLMAQGSTSFPQAIGLASTWNPDLVHEVFTATAAEMRARGGNYALDARARSGARSALGAHRGNVWRRSVPGVPYRRGGDSRSARRSRCPIDQQHVIATAKHFAVHGQPEGGRNAAPANYAERDIREFFLTPFEAAVTDAHVQSVMASYNEVNGIPVHVNHWLLRDVLRQEWGFAASSLPMAAAFVSLVNEHHVAADQAEAARQALQAGIDFELDHCFGTSVVSRCARAVCRKR